jgi:hypothetical protein
MAAENGVKQQKLPLRPFPVKEKRGSVIRC